MKGGKGGDGTGMHDESRLGVGERGAEEGQGTTTRLGSTSRCAVMTTGETAILGDRMSLMPYYLQ